MHYMNGASPRHIPPVFILMSLANKCPCILVFCVVYTHLFFGNSNVITLTTLSCGTLHKPSTTPASKLSSFFFNWWTRDLHHANLSWCVQCTGRADAYWQVRNGIGAEELKTCIACSRLGFKPTLATSLD